MLSVSRLSVSYGPIQAVREIDLDVPDGHFVSLIGANGAGKSSALNAVAGLIRPKGGRVLLDGEDVTGIPAHKLVRRGVAIVPEGRMVAAPLTVYENLRQCRAAGGRTAAQFEQELQSVYDMFPVLRSRRHQPAGLLSGGEQQMLAIARGVLTNPRVLLLDEPSMGLAPAVIDVVFNALLEIHHAGQTILLVEQNAELALEICDYAAVLQRGEIVARGTPAELRGTNEVVWALLG
ncbi:ABC transporter ATP-binding protein [Pseudonocardia sp.]|jgi:branched-chain amino acid transport system ATP-binding protein|uniref:ABC transporter ATP-binding protein n=1 Tax=Pseudonocardia sp. TaxID=60912 RepID=UPI003D1190A0